MFNLPKSCIVNKKILKEYFDEYLETNSNIKEEFDTKIEKILWSYRLSENTLGIEKTNDVEEIQIFEINLKTRKIPINAIKMITKIIPSKILFMLKYNNDVCYGIKVNYIYFSNWNEKIEFDFYGDNLENVYEDIVKKIIKEENTTKDFKDLIEYKNKKQELSKKIEQLNNKIKKEKQFNRKVELNKQFKKLENEMEELINE